MTKIKLKPRASRRSWVVLSRNVRAPEITITPHHRHSPTVPICGPDDRAVTFMVRVD